VATYTYDGLNRRVKKDLTAGTDVVYLYDGWRCIEEREWDAGDEAWEPRRQYVYGGQYIDELLIFDDDSDGNGTCTRYYYCQQANYNVVALTDSTGAVEEKAIYDPYGQPTVSWRGNDGQWGTQDDATGSSSFIGNPYMFQGRRWDNESALYYFRNRYYTSNLGRFLQRDPVTVRAHANRYLFCYDAPGHWVDSHGLSPRPPASDIILDYAGKIKNYYERAKKYKGVYEKIRDLHDALVSDDKEVCKKVFAKWTVEALARALEKVGVVGIAVKFIIGSSELASSIANHIAQEFDEAWNEQGCKECICEAALSRVRPGTAYTATLHGTTWYCYYSDLKEYFVEVESPDLDTSGDNFITDLIELFEVPARQWKRCK